MLYWSQIPLLRLLIPFLIGIVFAYYLFENLSIYISLPIILGLILLSFVISKHLKSYRSRWIHGFLAYLLFFFLGFFLCQLTLKKNRITYLPQGEKVYWLGELTDVKKQTDSSSSVEVQLAYYRDSLGKWVSTNERINAYLADSLVLRVGDWITAQSYIERLDGAQNPAQFDYADFLKKRFIYYQTYVKNAERHFHETSLSSLAASIRQNLIGKFKEAGIDGNRLSVLIAISLGDKSYLEKPLKRNYAGAGAMHILAVSGLHVGIVYLIFNAFFSLLKLSDKKHNRILKGGVLLIVVWGFAIITGLSPSVQRASCMFSFLIVADMVNRHSIALNSIAASAFFILLINPLMVFEVGFQLSYAAVLGIIWMHPIIYSWITPKYWLIDKAWTLIVVSIAAQLATLPFTLYYFHQFPNWFLLTNLGVIPLAFIIVSGAIVIGLLLTVFSTAFYLEYILEASLWLLNHFIDSLSFLPYFVTDGVWISLTSAGLIAFSLICLNVYLTHIKTKWLILSLASLLGVFLIEAVGTFKQVNQNQLVVYSIRNQSIYSVIEGLNAEVFVYNDTLDQYAEQIILNHLNSKGVKRWEKINCMRDEHSKYLKKSEHFQLLQMDNELVMLSKGIPNIKIQQSLPKEIVVIVRQADEKINQTPIQTKSKIIFDSSIPEWDYEYKKRIIEEGIYSVSKRGYFIKNW